ncbi:MAG: hypothetical protein IPJ74_16600 [Saprospiraceae bacterium]|nr:hypothetical protein [Saprospiraceae bacterium]
MLGKSAHEFSDIADKEAWKKPKWSRNWTIISVLAISRDSITFLNVKEIENLGVQINSRADEYFPFVSNDQKLLFFTGRRNNRADENIYYTQEIEGVWTESLPLGSKFNTSNHEGMSTVVRDGPNYVFHGLWT